jgi:16S rRNA (cytosine1402-N4)-methyltransferase
VVDATFGSGGHARAICAQLQKGGTFIGIDADETAFTSHTLDTEATVHLVNNNFKNLTEILSSLQIKSVDAILADLGWRMEQFAAGNKGFSFMHDEPLLMTFGTPEDYLFTARDIVNEWEETSIADVIFGYGEERYARRIAKAIVEARKEAAIETTFQLTAIVHKAMPKNLGYKSINPATKTFQALRIAVNDELGVLENFLKDGFASLKPGGRLAIITFHSLEDRVVKQYFRQLADADLAERTTKKPIIPSIEETKTNPRARSAKLRIITKI